MGGRAETYKCKSCGKPFKARVADRNRGWARFCSKSCKATRQEQRTGQFRRYLNAESSRDDLADGWVGLMDGHGQWED